MGLGEGRIHHGATEDGVISTDIISIASRGYNFGQIALSKLQHALKLLDAEESELTFSKLVSTSSVLEYTSYLFCPTAAAADAAAAAAKWSCPATMGCVGCMTAAGWGGHPASVLRASPPGPGPVMAFMLPNIILSLNQSESPPLP